MRHGQGREIAAPALAAPVRGRGAAHTRAIAAAALMSALLLHALILIIPLIPDAPTPAPKERAARAESVTRVRVVTDAEAARILARSQRARERARSEPTPPEPPREADDPYIPLTQLEAQRAPDRARYTGPIQTRAERETVRRAAPGAQAAGGAPARPTLGAPDGARGAYTPEPSPAAADPRSTPEQDRPGSRLAMKKPDGPERTQGGERAEPQSAREAEEERPAEQETSAAPQSVGRADGQKPDRARAAALIPGLGRQAAVSAAERGQGGSLNYLDDVEEGEKTLVNRMQNRYWAFWERLQGRLRREWSPGSELRRRDPYGNIYGRGLFDTVLDVTLNSDGSVRALRVRARSGLDFLDDEAVRAMNAAGPFPNPPEGLKDERGLVRFQFGFRVSRVERESTLFRPKTWSPFDE